MSFRITGLSSATFRPLFGLSDEALARRGARRCVATTRPGFPERVGLRDAEPGETLLLVNFVHHDADTPYRASHAIYVPERDCETFDAVDDIPEALRLRPISLRAFDPAGDMLDAELAEGAGLEAAIGRLLTQPGVAFLHAHFARPGCYAARIVGA